MTNATTEIFVVSESEGLHLNKSNDMILHKPYLSVTAMFPRELLNTSRRESN
jgi:hypothetical protein